MKPERQLKYTDMTALARHAAEHFPDTAFFLCSDEQMPHITGSELFRCCSKAAGVLDSIPSQHIAILGPGSAAWITAFFSVISAGRVIVPLHDGMNERELSECIRQADCGVLLYDSKRAETASAIRQDVDGLQMIELHDFLDAVRGAEDAPLPGLRADGAAAMYFTSGTTGRPRCVILTNRNMGSQISEVTEVLSLSEKDVGLSLLPLSHTFEMMTCIATALHCGGTLYINESIRTVKKNLHDKHPTVLVTVPLVLQTLHKEIINTAKKRGELSKLMKAMAINDKIQHLGPDLSGRLFKEVREPLGGALRTVICGGASLDPGIVHFFKVLGIEVLIGYGITECSPVVSVNRPGHVVKGSVGPPLPCCEVSIIDHEICVRGDSVSPGYYDDPEGTAEYFRDGWFHTGDLGRLDRKGNLFFEGRIKKLIILPNGENVSSEELEEKLYQEEGIIDAIVYEKDGKITAELYTDRRIGLPTQQLNVPLRWKREEVQEYAVDEILSAIEFLEEHTGMKCDWDALRDACEIWNAQNQAKFEKWDMNRTEIPPHTGAAVWLYRVFEHQVACGSPEALRNDSKVNSILRKQVAAGKCPKNIRHRALIWSTPANNYPEFNNWLLECWGIESVCEMFDIHGTGLIDTSTRENMLYGIADMIETSTMRAHTKGGYEVMLYDLWDKYEEYNADMIIMYDQISCKGVAAINGLFEEGAIKRGIPMCRVRHDLLDPTSVPRKEMRADVNRFMQAVMNESPIDASLLQFDDDESW